jgi:hypothetical protein
MGADIPNARCEAIRAYLAKNFSDCVVQEDLDATQQSLLTVRNGKWIVAPCTSMRPCLLTVI